MIKRICLYGGPGSGKTTLAYKLAGALKERHHDIHLVQEFIKLWAYQKKVADLFERVTVFERQLAEENVWLPLVRGIVVESPILLSSIYSMHYGHAIWPSFLNITLQFEKTYPSLNFYIGRQFKYVRDGRYQDEDQAQELDQVIRGQMIQHLPAESTYFDPMPLDQMLSIIEQNLTS